MLAIKKIQQISLQNGDGRHLRYVLQPLDLMDNDPFIILADDKFAHNTFADHPHAGIQTVTYVLEGSLEHYDSRTGGGGRLEEGDFQIMTAGRGIIHNENPDRGEDVRVLQLWVNLSSEHKKVDGQYEDLKHADVPVIDIEGGKIEVFSGEVKGIHSPLKNFTPFTYAAITIENNENEFTIPAGYNSYLYVLEGDVEIQQQAVKPFDVIHFDIPETDEKIHFKATGKSKFVIFAGLPIKEPVVARGPFVMNTNEEILEKFENYRNGTFLDGKPY